MKEVTYKILIRYGNGYSKKKTFTATPITFIHLLRRLRQQYLLAELDWEGSDGSIGSTDLELNKKGTFDEKIISTTTV
jgi:hypothetical protein